MIVVASSAGMSKGSKCQSGACWRTTMNAINTAVWKNMNTREVPMEESARISLGNDTFFTMPARSTMTRVAEDTAVEKKFQNNNPENR